MSSRAESIISVSSILTAVISIAVAVCIPAGYFVVAHRYMDGSIHTELAFSARVVESLINNNPKSWRYEELRLREIIDRRLDDRYQERRTIKDMHGRVVARTPDIPAGPVLRFSHPIYDSGVEVAQIELERLISPLIARTALIGVCSVLAGLAIFLIFRFFPLRAVREAYRNLEENESRLTLALESGYFGVWDWDMKTNAMVWDDRMYDIYGVSRDAAGNAADLWQNGLHPEDCDRVEEDIRPKATGDRDIHTEYRIVRPDGTVRYIRTDGIVLRDDDGKPVRLIGLNQDITERVQVEEKVRESEKKYRELYDFLPIPVFEMDLEGRVVAGNRAFYETFGVTEGNVEEGVDVWRFLSPEDKAKAMADLQRLLKSEKVRGTEYLLRRPEGSGFPAMFIPSIIYSDGKPAGLRGAVIDMADRKQAEEALRESETKFKDLTEKSIVGIYLVQDGLFRYVNTTLAGMFGYESDEIIDKLGPKDITFPEDLPLVEANLKKRLSGEVQSIRYEFRIQTKAQDVRHVEVHSSGTVYRGRPAAIGTLLDITDRKRSEALYHILAEQSMGAVFIVQDGKFRFINGVAVAYIGYTEDLRGRDADLMIHPEDKAMAARMAKEMLTGERTTAYEFRIVSKDHRVRWISQIVTPITYEDRPAILGNALDVTDLKESFARLEEMQALESSIMSAIPHVVIGLQDDLILFVNEAVESVFGWKSEDLIGHKINILCKSEKECRDLTGCFHAGHELGPAARQEAEIRCRCRDGRDIICKVTFCRTGGPSGDKIVSIFEDVTLAKMSYLQLLQAEKMASIGKLAAGVAHEINNPTAFVSSNLKTLAEYMEDLIAVRDQYRPMLDELKALRPGDTFPEVVRDRVRRIEDLETRLKIDPLMEDVVALIGESRDGTGRITRIVQDLKNFAHPGEEKQTTFNVNENIESTLSIVWNELKYKTVIQKDYGDVPQTLGYPQQLNQVFMNLLVNAAQAIEVKGEIRISTRSDNGWIEIKIADTGMGIPPENLPRLFDPFFTTKEVGRGTGLGLHVAYSIIEKHNGNISVESTVGVGTTFTVRIPVQTGV